MTTYERLKTIIIEQLAVRPEDVAPEKTFRDLGADSLDDVELIMGVEVEFDISIEDADAERVTTVAEAVTLVDSILTIKARQQPQAS